MTTQELYEAQKQIGILARKVPEDGFDGGDDRPGIKEIVRNLCLISVSCKLSSSWVRAALMAIADYYQWQVPPDNRWLLDACAQVGWWEFVAKAPYTPY